MSLSDAALAAPLSAVLLQQLDCYCRCGARFVKAMGPCIRDIEKLT